VSTEEKAGWPIIPAFDQRMHSSNEWISQSQNMLAAIRVILCMAIPQLIAGSVIT
jgi:hypothetical protein